MTQPLEGIRVLEVDNWGFAPSAGAVLADWGADVVKVEPPGRGDPLRAIFGTLNFGADGMVNFMHEQWNRNKRSIALDLTHADGRARARRADRRQRRVPHQLPPRRAGEVAARRADDVRRVKPDIVYALATGQGSKGPDAGRPSYDYVSAWARARRRRATHPGGRAVHPTAGRHRRHPRPATSSRARSRPRSCAGRAPASPSTSRCRCSRPAAGSSGPTSRSR